MQPQTMRDPWVQFIAAQKPNVLLTLGPGNTIRRETLDRAATHFINKLQRSAYGRGWRQRPATERPVALGFFEHVKTTLHLHIAMRAPTNELWRAVQLGAPLWQEIRPRAHYWFEWLERPEDYARYITKEFYVPETRENPFVYAPAK